MTYTFTGKRYSITFINKAGDIKKLVYNIVDTPVTALWLDRVRNAKSSPDCRVYFNQWATYIPTSEKICAHWDLMKKLVRETNSGDFVKVGHIEMPDEFDPTVDQQDLLNSLHFAFHKFEEEASDQFIKYNPLAQLNVEIHKLEYMVHAFKQNQLENNLLLACGFFLDAGFHNTVPIPQDLYLPYWNHSMDFGDLVLGYHTVGKNLQHCYQDNDIELIRKGFLRPQKEVSNEVQLIFTAQRYPNSMLKYAEKIKQWVLDNQLESYVDMSLPENNIVSQPLLGRVVGNYTKEFISNLFEHYKVSDTELFE
jgi:hypothetical protein